jgi:hypothetical protein
MIKEGGTGAQFLETSWSGEFLFYFSWPEAFCTEKGCSMQGSKQTADTRQHITPLTERGRENVSHPYSSNFSRLVAPYKS